MSMDGIPAHVYVKSWASDADERVARRLGCRVADGKLEGLQEAPDGRMEIVGTSPLWPGNRIMWDELVRLEA